MLKKSIFITLVLLFAVSVIFVYGQDRIAEIQQQMVKLANDYSSGSITASEYQRRVTVLQEEYTRLLTGMFDEQLRSATEQANADSAARDASDTRPIDGRRLEQLYDQYNTLLAALADKKITRAQFDERSRPIDNEIKAMTDRVLSNANVAIVRQASENNEKLWPGSTPGWPPADGTDSIRELCGLGPFIQTNGTRASYSLSRMGFNGPVNSFTVYQTGQPDTAFREMKTQIERMAGKPMERHAERTYRGDEYYRVWIPNPGGPGTGLNVDLYVNDNRAVVLSIAKLHD